MHDQLIEIWILFFDFVSEVLICINKLQRVATNVHKTEIIDPAIIYLIPS